MSDENSALSFDRADFMRRIERLDVPADVKVIIAKLFDVTVNVGGRLINLGARIVGFTFELAKAYPGLAFGVVAALVLSYLISSLPGVGPVLSPILTPLLLIIGITLGALDDITNGGMRVRLATLEEQLRTGGIG